MNDLPKQYSPKEYESLIYAQWEKAGIFSPEYNKDSQEPPYVIMLPPPNITGSLHMGHALQDVVMDVLIRVNRMRGRRTLWVPGTDHAAIATNRVVEKQLQQEGITRHDLGREEFLRRVDQWYEKTGAIILDQMKRLGCSCDWSRGRFTMDTEYVQSVLQSFITYYERGYIYRGDRIVNWCVRCESVISDLEVQHEEKTTLLVTLRYPFADGSGYIEVATTRPETMLGDTAVAVHPEDARYADSVGKTIMLPLVNREIPVIADERIDQSFGTGAVKVTPAHDPLDAQIGNTHRLDIIKIIGQDGTLTQEAGEFEGESLENARAKILHALQEGGYVVKEEEYTHNASLCERCDTVIEPLISRQWFVDMGALKDEAIDAVERDLVSFVPPRWKKHFLEWMNNVHDWTISRQIWLGHRIPVWWKPGTRDTNNEEGNFIVSLQKPEEGDWEQDPDVLDTWFSSAIWPIATLGWPENTSDLRAWYPTSTLVTGKDITYLWVARMIFSGLELMKGETYGNRSQEERIPFRDVFIYPTVLTKTGQRMSKSLGTGIDPLELIERYGADAVRFGLMRQLHYDSQALKFDEDSIQAARNFANKVWNISRLVLAMEEREEQSVADVWIQARSREVAREVTSLVDEYKMGEAARILHEFIWKEYADWYLEIVKEEGSTHVARSILMEMITLLHPFMPHITEVIWGRLGEKGMLATRSWVEEKDMMRSENAREAYEHISRLQDIVRTIRSMRRLIDLPARAKIRIYTQSDIPFVQVLEKMTRAEVVKEKGTHMRAFPLSDGSMLWIGAEEMTQERIEQARSGIQKKQKELSSFVSAQESALKNMRGKAPEDIVREKEKAVAEAKESYATLEDSLQLLQ